MKSYFQSDKTEGIEETSRRERFLELAVKLAPFLAAAIFVGVFLFYGVITALSFMFIFIMAVALMGLIFYVKDKLEKRREEKDRDKPYRPIG